MDINFVRLFFGLVSLAVAGIGFCLNFGEQYLPTGIVRSYRFGKFAAIVEHPVVSKLEVPKRWFKHFYTFAAPSSTFALLLMISRYIFGNPLPDFVNSFLDLLMGTLRPALISSESGFLAIMILTIQCWKRFYETHFVSVFSDAKMNLSHYMLGYLHYAGVLIAVLGESEGFIKGSSNVLRFDRLSPLQCLAAIVFLLASYEQLQTNFILANLRKNKTGDIVTQNHKVPRGRLFEYVSCPLQSTEITMYTMLSIILWNSSTYHYIFLWVIANQMECGILGHKWYLEKFLNYPKQRKAVVPFLF